MASSSAGSVSVGRGFVEIYPKVSQNALQALNAALTSGIDAASLGRSVGVGFSDSFMNSVNGQAMGRDFANQFDSGMGTLSVPAPDADEMGSAGEEAGESFGTKFMGAIMALGIGASIVSSVTGALDKESGNANLTAQLGLSPEEAKKAGEMAGKIYGGAYGGSMEEVNEGLQHTMSAFRKLNADGSQDIQGITEKALNLASVMDIDVGKASTLASEMVTNGFAKDGLQAMDQLTVAMQKVPASLQGDLTDALSEYGPFMKTLGLEGEKGLGMLVKASEGGSFALDKTGDALKEFTILSTDQSTSTMDTYKKLGLSGEEMTKAFLAGGDTSAAAFKKVVGGLKGMTDPAEQAAASLALFGTPIEDIGMDKLPMFLDSLGGVEGGLGDVTKAGEDFDKVLGGTLSATFTVLKRTIETNLTDFMTTEVLPVLVVFGKWFSETLVPAVKPVLEGFRDFVKVLVEWKDLLIPLGIFIGTFAGIIKTVVTVKAIWLSITTSMIAAQTALNAAWVANPIGLIVVLVIALVAAFVYAWKNIDGFKEFWLTVWDTMGIIIGGFVNWLKEDVGPAIGEFFAGMMGFFADTGKNVGGFFADVLTRWQAFLGGIAEGAIRWLTSIPATLGKLGADVAKFMGEAWANVEQMGARVGGFFVKVGEGIGKGFNIAKEFVSSGFRNVIEFFISAGDSIRNVFIGIGDTIGGIFKNIVGYIKGVINTLIRVVNAPIRAINSMNFRVPSWVPGIGGAGFAPRISQIPELYTGGNISGSKDGTLAVLGDRYKPETVSDLGLTNDTLRETQKLVRSVKLGQVANGANGQVNKTYHITEARDSAFEIAREIDRMERFK